MLAFVGQLALFVCGWLFARTVMSARLALLAVGLFIALPSNYGAVHTFKYVESYLTPRQLAEAATLAALAASMTGRYALTCACTLAAMLLQMQYSAISQPRATNWSSLRARVMPYSATRTAPAASGFIDWNRFLSNIPRDLIPDREMEVIRRKYPAGQASSRLAFTNVDPATSTCRC